ncbi:hypothetical protein PAECIP111891_03179 [Paenibacillus allorhizoplanae]|uniref:PNPLA domain-containing protein n=1 Tax=Paenibacillus allorhizoplanae TaxID=2905648 RepID=A0ABN8GMK6_9BACL|nr:patatin-like phospholipase family protein [Paenibacillus allorhizoplanae]CAH1208224.1 hypothetical protein PAECIP111891_03179 [Paenibacillus allorhizoplanae]
MEYPFKNLVFEGGGVKGVAFVGVMDALEQQQKILPNIIRVAGTSAGAIVALLVGLNYSSQEIHEELHKLDLRTFTDDDPGIILDTVRFIDNYGWHKGDKFKKWIEEIVEQKTGSPHSTFQDVFNRRVTNNFKEIYIIGTNIRTHCSEVFSHETTADMKLADAVRISMSIPLFFESVKYKDQVYVDGGLLFNYPLRLFDRYRFLTNKEHGHKSEILWKKGNGALGELESHEDPLIVNIETLGIRIDSKNGINIIRNHSGEHFPVRNIYEFTKHLIGTIFDMQQNNSHLNEDVDRTVLVDSGTISAINFDITDKQKKELIDSGLESTSSYLASYKLPIKT